MKLTKRITAFILSTALTVSASASALAQYADSVINFSSEAEATVKIENGTLANAAIDEKYGRLVIRPNYEKDISVQIDFSEPTAVNAKFIKIRYAFKGGFNKNTVMAADIAGKRYIFDSLSDKEAGSWYEAIVSAENLGTLNGIKLLPLYSGNSDWTTGNEVYIDYIGFFANEEMAKAYSEKDDSEEVKPAEQKIEINTELISAGKSYVNGYASVERTFKPESNITRAEMISILSRISTASAIADIPLSCTDVTEGSWYYDAVKKMNVLGVVSGTEFYPERAVTRGELAEFLYNMGVFTSPEKKHFTDIDVNNPLYEILLNSGNVFVGYGDGSFRADNLLTRAESIVTVNRLLNVQPGDKDSYPEVYTDVPRSHWAFCDIMAVSDVSAINTQGGGNQESAGYDGIFDVYNTKGSEWIPVPIRSKSQKEKGLMGGEGCQYFTYLAIDSTGQYIATFVDVGTVCLSKDGGQTYQETGRGLACGGMSLGVFDPNNSARLIGGAMNGTDTAYTIKKNSTANGLYLSEDYMENFTEVFIYNNQQMLRDKDMICFDPTSYSEEINGSAIVYYSTPDNEFTGDYKTTSDHEIEMGYNEGPGLYRSDDGGYTWKLVNKQICGANLAVTYENGYLYAAMGGTLYRSKDKGETFETIQKDVYDIDAIKTKPNGVYILTSKGVSFVPDSGDTIKLGSAAVSVEGVNSFRVSPVNQKNMAFSRTGANVNEKYHIMYSNDGGSSWNESKFDASSSIFPLQPRSKSIIYSPTDENKMWVSADIMESSDDAGANFKWDYNGGLAACINAWWIPNVHNPDLWFVPIQDFVGAVTADGGDTFEPAEEWGMSHHSYGGYMLDEDTMFRIECPTWEPNTGTLKMTSDHGKTWETKGTVNTIFLYMRCFELPYDGNVLFAGDLRSTDRGKTWKAMPDCACVFGFDDTDPRLFGVSKDRKSILISNDKGATWSKYLTIEQDPAKEWNTIGTGLGYDYKNDILYYAQYGKIWKYQNGELKSLWENMDKVADSLWCYGFTVDPIHPEVIYISGVSSRASYFNVRNEMNDYLRSCDSGETWQVISPRPKADGTIVKTGPVFHHDSRCPWVHPETGYLYVGTNMSGMYKLAPPYEVNN